jgi:hypothetical protein
VLLLLCSFVALQLIGLETPTGGNAGSTMDAMSDAIEGADVMLYGVSLAYKESANVSGLSNLRVGIVCPSALRHEHTLMVLLSSLASCSVEWKLTMPISKSSI